MPNKWLFRSAMVAIIAASFLLGSQLLTRPLAQKEVVIADIVHNWQEAHPATNRFVVLPDFNNEAVLDTDTELIWEIAPKPTPITWNEARTTCSTRSTGGQKGWRLPAPIEMRSLVGPAVDSPIPNIPPGHPFVNIQPTSYWSVVPESHQPTYAKYVDAFLGNVLSFVQIYTFPAWCVRGPIESGQH